MDRFFSAVSFQAPRPPEYHKLRDLFLDDAQVVTNDHGWHGRLGIEQFIQSRQSHLRDGLLGMYRAQELSQVTDVHGRTGHRFSTFREVGTDSGVRFDVVGSLSTQFLLTVSGWKMSAIIWDGDRAQSETWASSQ